MLCSLRPQCARANTSRPLTFSRNVVSVQPSRVYAKKPTPRLYSERKAFLYNQYMKLLRESGTTSPLIFLRHTNFSVNKLTKLRRDIQAASQRVVKPSLSASSVVTDVAQPDLRVVRSPILGVAMRDFGPLGPDAVEQISKLISGNLAILTLPTLNPPQLQAILRALDRTVPVPKPETAADKEKKRLAKLADPANPGRREKRTRPDLAPELVLAGALIDGRVFAAATTREVAKLPTLDTLRAQIVGMLSQPAMQLAGMLSQASGGQLARTLEGLKISLEAANAVPNDTL